MVIDYKQLIQNWQDSGLRGLQKELLRDYNPEAQKIMEILDKYSSILEKYPEQLPSFLIASVLKPEDEYIKDLALELAKVEGKPWLKPIAPFPPDEEACVAIIQEHSNFVGGLVCLSNDIFVSSSEDAYLKVWDLKTKKSFRTYSEHEFMPINYISLSPDKRYLLSAGDDNNVKVWDISSWTVLRTLKGHTNYVSKVAETTSGKIVSVSKDQTVRIWDFNSGKCLHVLEGHNAWVYALAVSPDGKRAVTFSLNSTMIVWDLETGQRVQTIVDGGGDVHYIFGLYLGGKNYSGVGHEEAADHTEWLADGRVISAAKDIIVWNDVDFTEKLHLEGHPWKIKRFVLFNKNRNLASVANCIKIWDLETGKELVSLLGHNGEELYSIAITPDENHILTGDKKGVIKVWDVKKLLSGDRITGHMSWANGITVSPDGNLAATCGYDRTVIIWDINTGKPLHRLSKHSELGVKIVGFRSEGKELITASSGQILIWNTKSGELVKGVNIENKLYTVDSSTILENGMQVFTGTMCYKPMLWDLESGMVKPFKIRFGFSSGTISGDGQFLLATTYPTNLLDEDKKEEQKEPNFSPVYLWDLKRNELIREFWFAKEWMKEDEKDKDEVKIYPSKVIFSPKEDEIIAGYNNGHVCVWNRDSGEIIKSFKASSEYITRIFLTFDGNLATMAQNESSIKIWNLEDFSFMEEIPIPGTELKYTTLSLDHEKLVTSTKENTIILMDLVKKEKICALTLPKDVRDLKLHENKLFVTTSDVFLYGFELLF